MSCVLCKRSCDVFNVHTIYGNADSNARDDIIEILGKGSESCLCATDCVCDVCMNMLKNVTKLKWKLRQVIADENESVLPGSLGKIWEFFANREGREQTKIRARKRSLSRSSGVGPSDLSESSEIIEAFDRKRKKKKDKKGKPQLYCMEGDCPLYFGDLDVLNCHRIVHHNKLALHFCDECNQKYTTAKHLNLHKRVHAVGPFWCLMCSAELKNQESLQKHLQQHAIYSVPCKYCDKSFLKETFLNEHVLRAHSDKKAFFSRKNIIIDRIDAFKVNEPVGKDKAREKSRYKVFVSPFTDIECHFNENDLKGTLMAATTDISVPPTSSRTESEIIDSEIGDALSDESLQ